MTTNAIRDTSHTLQAWRENFLRIILRVALVFAFLALIPSLSSWNDPFTPLVNLAAYALLIVITFAPIPYVLRAGIFILLPFALGAVGLIDTGIWGDSRLFLFATVVFTAMLLSTRAAVVATIISLGATADRKSTRLNSSH